MRCSAIVHPPDPARAVALSALRIREYASIAASAAHLHSGHLAVTVADAAPARTQYFPRTAASGTSRTYLPGSRTRGTHVPAQSRTALTQHIRRHLRCRWPVVTSSQCPGNSCGNNSTNNPRCVYLLSSTIAFRTYKPSIEKNRTIARNL